MLKEDAMRFVTSRPLFIAVCMALAWRAVAGQVVYKLVDKDGKSVYSDHVIPGMSVVGKLVPPPQPDPELAAAARAAQAERAQHAKAYAKERLRALDAADASVRQAEQKLAEARQALEAGTQPLPSELLGTVRGFVRLSDAYWTRMSELQRELLEATRDLEQAYSERNAMRD
jgi:hypothetical protein